MFTTSDTNNIIAALMLTSLQYEKTDRQEAGKYKELELRMREAFYPMGENTERDKIKIIYPKPQQ